MLDPVQNFANLLVSTTYDALATSITLAAGETAKLPDPATLGAFNLTWYDATTYPSTFDDPNVEIVRVTAIAGDVLTVTRAQESTTASTKNTASVVYRMILSPTKKTIDDIDTQLTGLGDAMIYKGDWDASAVSFPGAGVAQKGWFYRVSVAGTVNSISFAVDDNIVATVNGASTTVYASNWSQHQQQSPVTLAGTPNYLTILGQVITRALINLTSHVTGILPIANGGTASSTASGARTALGVDAAGTDNSTNVSLNTTASTINFLTIAGQVITLVKVALASEVSGLLPIANGGTGASTLAGASVPTYTSTNTFTNKRITKREQTVASAATVTPVWTNDDIVTITAQAVGLTLANPAGTGTDGQAMVIKIKDNATSRTITYGTQYRAIGVTLPVATTASKTIYLGGFWNVADSKIDITAVAEEA